VTRGVGDPLRSWDALQAFGSSLTPGQVKLDLVLGADSQSGIEARARAGIGITDWLQADAETFATDAPGQPLDFGAMAGLSAHFSL
jgi:hypothetical protein